MEFNDIFGKEGFYPMIVINSHGLKALIGKKAKDVAHEYSYSFLGMKHATGYYYDGHICHVRSDTSLVPTHGFGINRLDGGNIVMTMFTLGKNHKTVADEVFESGDIITEEVINKFIKALEG